MKFFEYVPFSDRMTLILLGFEKQLFTFLEKNTPISNRKLYYCSLDSDIFQRHILIAEMSIFKAE